MDAAQDALRRRWVDRMAHSAWVRRAVIVGVGLAVFGLGSAYLNLQYPADEPAYLVIGTGVAERGQPLALRATGRLMDSRRPVPLRFGQASLEGIAVPLTLRGADPVTVHLVAPPAVTRRAADLILTVNDEAIPVPLRIRGVDSAFERALSPEPSRLPATTKPVRFDLITEGGGVIARLKNRLFVLVRDVAGRPVDRAVVEVAHSSFPAPLRLQTDAAGVADFTLIADQPSYTFRFTVRTGGRSAQFEEVVVPAGRQLLIRSTDAVVRPGASAHIHIDSWRTDKDIFCDVRRGDVWLTSATITADARAEGFDTGPLQRPGRYDVQCYFHPHSPGKNWSAVPLLVTDEAPLTALRRAVRQEAVLHPAALSGYDSAQAERLMRMLEALITDPLEPPRFLANTFQRASTARDERYESTKTTVLLMLGAVFILVLLLVADLILRNILAQRDRMRAFAADLADDETADGDSADVDDLIVMANKSRAGLVRTRGALMVVLVGGTLLANVAAFIALMALIK